MAFNNFKFRIMFSFKHFLSRFKSFLFNESIYNFIFHKTALHIAAINEDTEMVKLLLQREDIIYDKRDEVFNKLFT